MCSDYSYQYEWDKEYCYPNSTVLINKLNIQDSAALSNAEREITAVRLAAAKTDPIQGIFDLPHLQRIHAYIFGDIYSWAGNLRHVNIAKGNQFCLAMHLTTYADTLFRRLREEHYLIGAENVPQRLAYYLSEINVLHPFREGNGRSQRLFIEYLAGVAGYHVNFSGVSAREMIIASADSFACKYDSINAMFERIATPISQEAQQSNIAQFFGKGSQPEAWFQMTQQPTDSIDFIF